MAKITVYTTPSCVQCRSTKKRLETLGLDFDVVDLSVDDAAMAMVKTLGYTRAPVVMTGEQHWSGFQPDRIDALAA